MRCGREGEEGREVGEGCADRGWRGRGRLRRRHEGRGEGGRGRGRGGEGKEEGGEGFLISRVKVDISTYRFRGGGGCRP